MKNQELPVYLVVGGSGAVGGAVVENLLQSPARVISTTMSFSQKAKPSDREGEVRIELDLASDLSISTFVKKLRSEFPALSGVVFASGKPYGATVQLAKSDDIREVFQVNAFGPIDLARRLFSHLHPGSSVIFLSSVAADWHQRGNSIYGSAKLSLERMAQGLAREVGSSRVRIHVLRPGAIQTQMFDGMSDSSKLELVDASSSQRVLTKVEVANLLEYLLKPESSALTSSRITFDAGFWD